ncbi:MAG: tetratricopeptide repeat protein [Rhodocyclaceae bacterium]|nr:tetratricopeptide repeat protein [Rhodocyclaceae bacterium]
MNMAAPQTSASMSIDRIFQQAFDHHQSGALQDAERLYRIVLHAQPGHPDANHNLGVLAVRAKKPIAAIPHLKAALQAAPDRAQYWLSYIAALIDAGMTDIAKVALEQGRQQGLQGQAVDSLAMRLKGGAQRAGILDAATRRSAEALVPSQKAAELMPADAGSLNDLGNAHRRLGRLDDAVIAFSRAIEIKPNYVDARNNLGITLRDLGKYDDAIASFRLALQINPADAGVHNNLGNVLKDVGQLDAAVACYRRALEIVPDFAETHNNLGLALRALGQLDAAVMHYRRALEIKPDFAWAYANLGYALMHQGKSSEALACFRQQLRLAPRNGTARHLIAALTGENTDRAPIEYVETLFDNFADTFDGQLRQVLEYDVPEQLARLVRRRAPSSVQKFDVLDLGCGTGLVGMAFAPMARTLVGVDISFRMLAKARARDLYERLERSDLLEMMRAEKDSSFDMIVAADLLIYFGKIDPVVHEIKRLLRPGGFFAFSVEALDASSSQESGHDVEREYRLESTGRYSHSADYLTRLAAAHGFLAQEMAETRLRVERGTPVRGYLVLWKVTAVESDAR